MTRQTSTTVIAAVVTVFLAILIAWAPIPFASRMPGEVSDFLAEDFIQLDGLDSSPVSGVLLYPGMQVTGADQKLSLLEGLAAYVHNDRSVLPSDAIYPVGQTPTRRAELRAAENLAMQQAAVVAALQAAGEPVRPVPLISSVSVSGPAYLVLQPGDSIVAVDGVAVSSEAEVIAAMRKHAIGDLMLFDVLRDDRQLSLSVTTVAANDDPRVPRVGIELEDGYLHTATLHFASNAQFGPGAGLPVALAVYLILSPDDLVGSQKVAAVGRITAEGGISAVDGVRERARAAASGGATVFLVPNGNCSALIDSYPTMQLVQVGQLSDAITSLAKIALNPTDESVPRC